MVQGLGLFAFMPNLEGQGTYVAGRLITPIAHTVTLIIPIIHLLAESP